ncbi:MAG: hypothetical protein ABSG65_34150 [Bryobacteraceae bacterium]|jgi:hypothetical protein
MASRRKPLIARTGLNAVPAILVAMGLLVIAAAVPNVVRAAKELAAKAGSEPASGGEAKKLQQRVDELGRQIGDLARKRDALKDRLDVISQQANQNQWLLSIVLAVAGLLTLAQGAFAFFSAQNYAKQADDAVRKIEARAAEASARFPLLEGTERANERAFERLTRIRKQLNIDQNLYKRLNSDPIARQEILSLESFAVTQFLASEGNAPGVIDHLQLLGKFYADKYVSGERKFEADFERALYYCTLVYKMPDRDISALNELGWLHMMVEMPPNLKMARALFNDSLAAEPKQQRALYNLGYLVFDPEDVAKLAEARGYFERAAKIENWEKTPNEDSKSRVYYNLACAYSRLAEHEDDTWERQKLRQLATAALDKAADKGGTERETFEGDIKKGGDLYELASSRPAQVAAIWQRFCRAWEMRGGG